MGGSLSKTERAVLDALTAHPGGITADIARAAGTARSTTGKALAALEKPAPPAANRVGAMTRTARA